MLERSTIQSSGFSNLGPEGARTGFRLRLRQPNYRGMRLSLIEGVDVVVDGERFAAADNRILFRGRTYGLADLDGETETRWPVGETIDVLIDRPGGLVPGVHQVETILWMRHPYFPPQFRPVPMRDAREATIVL
ncbi:DUF6379 domain-containing protein [Sphingomonas sp. R1]|uniref:C-glycoside deglycosidase beta subunit domain-containing protein n=1 Tax=Sphingomonas sp. R1 TaxID=399176 RepID=UPI0022250290|nr:DUF6379 domain-containing protein [Sphingomonas sp. R1]UYY78544.1 DUF6379 domain-containing protein [Sphingomonas sp. R1]